MPRRHSTRSRKPKTNRERVHDSARYLKTPWPHTDCLRASWQPLPRGLRTGSTSAPVCLTTSLAGCRDSSRLGGRLEESQRPEPKAETVSPTRCGLVTHRFSTSRVGSRCASAPQSGRANPKRSPHEHNAKTRALADGRARAIRPRAKADRRCTRRDSPQESPGPADL